MSIKNRQSVKIINSVLKKSLIGGTMPTVKELLAKTSIEERTKTIGAPLMVPVFAEEFKKADIAGHNKMLDDSAEDIDLLYAELIEQNERIQRNFIYAKTQSERLSSEIKKTTEKLKNMILMASNTNDYVYTIYDYFNDYSNTIVGESSVNIKDGVCGMGTKLYKNMRIPSDEISISFVPSTTSGQSIKSILATGDIQYAIDANVDTLWQYHIESSVNGTQSFQFLLESPDAIECNRIHMLYTSPSKINVSIRYTPDKINWFSIPGTIENNLLSVDVQFNTIRAYAFEITMSKDTADISDITNAGASFSYIFGIQDIALYHNAYLEDGLLVSIPYSVETNVPVSKISLHTEEEVPSGSSIEYSLSVNGGDFMNISPVNEMSPKYEQVIKVDSMYTVTPITFEFISGVPSTSYELGQYQTQGIKFYKLGNSPTDLLDHTAVLYKGKDAWEVERYSSSTCTADNFNEIYELIKTNPPQTTAELDIIKNNSFFQLQPTYVPINQENKSSIIDAVGANTITRYSVSFMSEIENIIANNPSSNKRCAIYFNGVKIYHGTPTSKTYVSYNVKQGLNTIDLYIMSDTIEDAAVNLDLDIYNMANYVYGHSKPLEKVSLFNLRYNTRYMDHERYAIDSGSLIVNNCSPGLRYDLFYQYAVADIESVQLKARLHIDKELSNIGPKIKSYQIRFI